MATTLIAAGVIGPVALVFFASARYTPETKANDETDAKKRLLNEAFLDYPLGVGKAKLSTGHEVTLPYHIYDGWASAVRGACDLAAAQKVCALESYQPVEIQSGCALGLVSFWNFTEANTGPHTECQFTLLVTRRESIDEKGNSKSNPPKVVPDASFATFTTMIQPKKMSTYS